MSVLKVKILFCKPCGFEKQANRLSTDLISQFTGKLDSVELEPTEKIGNFEVFLEEELIYSKMRIGRLPNPGEIEQIIMKKIVSLNG